MGLLNNNNNNNNNNNHHHPHQNCPSLPRRPFNSHPQPLNLLTLTIFFLLTQIQSPCLKSLPILFTHTTRLPFSFVLSCPRVITLSISNRILTRSLFLIATYLSFTYLYLSPLPYFATVLPCSLPTYSRYTLSCPHLSHLREDCAHSFP